MRRPAPRPLSAALEGLSAQWAPVTLLAEVQRVWRDVAGAALAREATPTGERAGELTVLCSSSLWAHELDLMGPALVDGLNLALGGPRVRRLRCTATRPRSGA
jgi:predicted nucleic acid-binding Zn ribbon protein